MKTLCEKPRLRRLLDHFSAVTAPRAQWRVAYPLPEVLLLVVCGTIASCDDCDDIVDWGQWYSSWRSRLFSAVLRFSDRTRARVMRSRLGSESTRSANRDHKRAGCARCRGQREGM